MHIGPMIYEHTNIKHLIVDEQMILLEFPLLCHMNLFLRENTIWIQKQGKVVEVIDLNQLYGVFTNKVQ
jgi:hypothetical protein